jgi:hypothetical protein
MSRQTSEKDKKGSVESDRSNWTSKKIAIDLHIQFEPKVDALMSANEQETVQSIRSNVSRAT